MVSWSSFVALTRGWLVPLLSSWWSSHAQRLLLLNSQVLVSMHSPNLPRARELEKALNPRACEITQICQFTGSLLNLVNPARLAVHTLPSPGCNPLQPCLEAFSGWQVTKSDAFHLSVMCCVTIKEPLNPIKHSCKQNFGISFLLLWKFQRI